MPPERLIAANVGFQFAIFSFLCRVIVVPYNASVIAHEQMHIYAYISMYDAVFQLILIVLLKYISFDSLIVYGAFMFLVSLSNLLLYYAYCRIAYQECRFKRIKDWSLYKEMFSFASWAFIGGFGFVARGQGVNLVINSFCGPAVNTARAVAYQVQSAILTFVGSFQQADRKSVV